MKLLMAILGSLNLLWVELMGITHRPQYPKVIESRSTVAIDTQTKYGT